MVDRSLYDKVLEEIKSIYSHHSGCDFNNSLSKVMNIRDNFDIKLMLIGHFSAGKTALINSLIGKRGFLKESQEPQTAIATELKYDEIESAYAFDVNGNKEVFDAQKEYISSQYNRIEFRINSPVLKEINDFTIVDTPGFDAGIEAHTKALTNYIGVGSAYLVVIDQEKGGIDQTTLDFIREISNYSSQVAVLINKCDKITEEIAESIAESARFTLMMNGLSYRVYTVSSIDSDISEKLRTIISFFNAQEAFNKVMLREIKAELFSTEKILEVTKQRMYLDTYDLDSDIAMYSRLEEQLSGAFAKKRDEANQELDDTVQDVISSIKNALISDSDSVAEALCSYNQVAAQAIIVETIRPIMLSSMKNISTRQIDSITDTLDFTGVISESDSMNLADVALNLAGNLKNLIEQGMFDSLSVSGSDTGNTDKKKNMYRAITGIAAIATNVVAPWLEVVIVLLPDIINILQGLFGDSNVDLVKRRYINNVIPQIINKIYPQVRQNTESTIALVIDEYEKMLDDKIESIKNNLTEAHNKKNKKVEDYENYKKIITEDIDTVKKVLSELGE